MNRDAQVIIKTRDNRRFMVEMQFGIKVKFFQKIAIVSDVLKVMGSSFQILGAVTEKARLPKLSFVLGTISCEIVILISFHLHNKILGTMISCETTKTFVKSEVWMTAILDTILTNSTLILLYHIK